jgi:DNA end-binding protein Ku
LAPEENRAKAFALLRKALEETGRAAVAKVAIREKESLCLVRPFSNVLTLETLFDANEVRSTRELENAARADHKVSSRELQMAVSLVENLSDAFRIERYEDEYQVALEKLLEAKVKGKPLPEAPAARGAVVLDLMELRASIEATKKKGTRPAARSSASRSRGPQRRRKSA